MAPARRAAPRLTNDPVSAAMTGRFSTAKTQAAGIARSRRFRGASSDNPTENRGPVTETA